MEEEEGDAPTSALEFFQRLANMSDDTVAAGAARAASLEIWRATMWGKAKKLEDFIGCIDK